MVMARIVIGLIGGTEVETERIGKGAESERDVSIGYFT